MSFTIKPNSMIKSIKIVCLIMGICSCLLVQGATETYSSRLSGSTDITSGLIFEVQEGSFNYMFNNPSPTTGWVTEFTNQSVRAFIELGWDEALQTTTINAYDYTVRLNITTIDLGGIPISTVQKDLQISFDANSQIDKSIDLIAIDGFHKLKIEIVSIFQTGTSTPVFASENMYLETRFVIERYYDFPETSQHAISTVNVVPLKKWDFFLFLH